jgi:tetratricopeptide (TPR) repeat protein
MGSWLGAAPPDREALLESAARARTRGRRRKAIALYRYALALERGNPEIHARLAPLLAETGQDFDAWNSFRASAQAALRAGRDDRALAVYREATHALPREIQAWQALARLLVKQGEERAAIEALIEGSQRFRAPFLRAQAIHLLRRARTIEPWHFESVIELAGLLRRCEQREEARLLLDELARRTRGARLRRVHTAQLWLDPGPTALWRWLRTQLENPRSAPATAPERSGRSVYSSAETDGTPAPPAAT